MSLNGSKVREPKSRRRSSMIPRLQAMYQTRAGGVCQPSSKTLHIATQVMRADLESDVHCIHRPSGTWVSYNLCLCWTACGAVALPEPLVRRWNSPYLYRDDWETMAALSERVCDDVRIMSRCSDREVCLVARR